MPNPQLSSKFLFLLVLAQAYHVSRSHVDVGTAAHYRPPYLPTVGFGSDAAQFSSSILFGSAGEGIWDNGAACGREYLVRCINAAVIPRTCISGQTIQIRIVDRALNSVSRPSKDGTSMVLSTTAFGIIANATAASISIEFLRYKSSRGQTMEAPTTTQSSPSIDSTTKSSESTGTHVFGIKVGIPQLVELVAGVVTIIVGIWGLCKCLCPAGRN